MTREDYIEIFKQYKEKPTLINEISSVEEAAWLDEALDAAIKALEQTVWIPASESLPEMYEEIGILKKYVSMRSDEVIVTIRDNKNGSVVTHSKCYLWDGKWHGDIFDWLKASKVDYEVIAWMPLPKPYEPQESEVK